MKPADEPRPPELLEAEPESAADLPWRKILLLALAAGLLLAVVYFSPLRHYLGHLREVSDSIRGLGVLAPLVLTLSVAVLVAVGFPRLLFCVIAGMALGFWPGLLWTQLGTLLGNYAVFVLVHRGGGDWARRYLSKRGKLRNLVRGEGIAGVIIARQLPVPGLVVNLVCGLFCFRHRDYLLGTALGQLPAAVPCTLIGAGVLGASFQKSLGLIALAVVLAVAAWLGLKWFMRRQRSAGPAFPVEPPAQSG
jgi:uncharacterized membrane protein YdjX (TVP38/TMEM64 family)